MYEAVAALYEAAALYMRAHYGGASLCTRPYFVCWGLVSPLLPDQNWVRSVIARRSLTILSVQRGMPGSGCLRGRYDAAGRGYRSTKSRPRDDAIHSIISRPWDFLISGACLVVRGNSLAAY